MGLLDLNEGEREFVPNFQLGMEYFVIGGALSYNVTAEEMEKNPRHDLFRQINGVSLKKVLEYEESGEGFIANSSWELSRDSKSPLQLIGGVIQNDLEKILIQNPRLISLPLEHFKSIGIFNGKAYKFHENSLNDTLRYLRALESMKDTF